MPKILLTTRYSIVEPLGILHLSTTAKQNNWEPYIVLYDGDDFSGIDYAIKNINPDLVGFSLYTGNHTKVLQYVQSIHNVPTIIGGHHATYFPEECAKYSDYVVTGQGLYNFEGILKGKTKKGISVTDQEKPLPIPHRDYLYSTHPSYYYSPIKSIITHTGCPFSCTYCYNSSSMFPKVSRPVDDIINEIRGILTISPNTQMIYFQDDVFGANLNWLREFVTKFKFDKLSYHAQTRFEYIDPYKETCRNRVELLKESNCTGLTVAIESAIPIIRTEVLNRNTPEELIYRSLKFLRTLGFKVRTEQMLGLPCGATNKETEVGIEADLKTLELNVKLKEEVGLPTLAWASIFSPYKGTKIYDYCIKHGFYSGENEDIPETFFEGSVLNAVYNWVGSNLSPTDNAWMSENDLLEYREQLKTLRDIFQLAANIKNGHIFAREFIEGKKYNLDHLSTALRRHCYDNELYNIV